MPQVVINLKHRRKAQIRTLTDVWENGYKQDVEEEDNSSHALIPLIMEIADDAASYGVSEFQVLFTQVKDSYQLNDLADELRSAKYCVKHGRYLLAKHIYVTDGKTWYEDNTATRASERMTCLSIKIK